MSTIVPSGIKVHPTSKNSAECEAIALRATDTVRLVFKPVIVNNPTSPAASIDGNFVWERKLANNTWQELTDKRLNELRAGEGFRLSLHAGELLTFYEQLTGLYELHRQQGVPRRQRTYVSVESEIASFLAIGAPKLRAFLDGHQKNAADMLLKLLEWLSQSPHGPEAARRLVMTAPQRIKEMTALLGMASLKDTVQFYESNKHQHEEEFWQRELSSRSFLFSQVFSYPIVVIAQKAYVGGKQIDNRGGGLVDFLAKVAATDSVVFIEIKTPQTPLLGSEYRRDVGVYPLSQQLTGAIAQVLRYRQILAQNLNAVKGNNKISTADAKCLVIAGSSEQLKCEQKAEQMKDCFELQRERIRDVVVLTFDELFGRVSQLIQLLERGISIN